MACTGAAALAMVWTRAAAKRASWGVSSWLIWLAAKRAVSASNMIVFAQHSKCRGKRSVR